MNTIRTTFGRQRSVPSLIKLTVTTAMDDTIKLVPLHRVRKQLLRDPSEHAQSRPANDVSRFGHLENRHAQCTTLEVGAGGADHRTEILIPELRLSHRRSKRTASIRQALM